MIDAPKSVKGASAPKPKRRKANPYATDGKLAKEFAGFPEKAEEAALVYGFTERQWSVFVRWAAGLSLYEIAKQDATSKGGSWNVWLSAVKKIDRERKKGERVQADADRFARAARWVEARPAERFDGPEPKVVREARAVLEAWEAGVRARALEKAGVAWKNGRARRMLEGAYL